MSTPPRPGRDKARVAVLGNSHAATLWFAWKEANRSHPQIASLAAFARPNGNGGLKGFALSGRAFRAEDPELVAWLERTAGRATLEIDHYDAFVVHAMGIDPRIACDAARHLAGRRYSEHLLRAHAEDIRREAKRTARHSPIHRFAGALRSVTDAPVIVTHEPWFAETHPDCAKLDGHALRVQQAILAGLKDLCDDMRCDFVPQPVSTVTPNGFSRSEFARKDDRHMNAAFGRLLLDEIGRLAVRR